jgi:hypothetical protein
MEKKKIEVKDLAIERKQRNLEHYQPFLKRKFRAVLKTELKDAKVLKELFGENETEFYKLEAVYAYQNL